MINFPILYVEDDHAIRENMYTILNRQFSNLHVAENGLVGLDLYHKISPRELSMATSSIKLKITAMPIELFLKFLNLRELKTTKRSATLLPK